MRTKIKNVKAARDQFVSKLFQRFNVLFAHSQKRWADWMAKRTAKLSRRSLYVALFSFVAISLAYNSMILVGDSGNEKIRVGRIKVPSVQAQPSMPSEAFVRELKRVKSFTRLMDSLYRSPNGRKTYDSIMRARPGLLDSARTLEKLALKF